MTDGSSDSCLALDCKQSASTPLFAIGAFVFDDTGGVITQPIDPDGFAILHAREPVDQLLDIGTDIGVSLCIVGKVGFVELAARPGILDMRFGNNNRDTYLFSGQEILTFWFLLNSIHLR